MPWQIEASLRVSGGGSQGSIPRETTSKLGSGERATFLGRKATLPWKITEGTLGWWERLPKGMQGPATQVVVKLELQNYRFG